MSFLPKLPACRNILLLSIYLCIAFNSFGQDTTFSFSFDSTIKQKFNFPSFKKSFDFTRSYKNDSDLSLSGYFKSKIKSKPLINISNGSVIYNLFYRSTIDTPFYEKNIIQHTSYGNMNISMGIIPFRVNYLLRRTNSQYYTDINDVQIEFDAASFGMNIKGILRDKLNSILENSKDTLLESNYEYYLQKLKSYNSWITNPINNQKLREAYEILNVPGISYNSAVSDSANLKKETALKKDAEKFIAFYNKQKEVYGNFKKETDTLRALYGDMLKKISTLKDIINKKLNANLPISDITKQIEDAGLGKIDIPDKYKWLINTRKFSIGRSQLNHSELTTKNIGINGINYEYNSNFYFAFTAGSVNYRFRDLGFNSNLRNRQYLVMTRLGIGSLYKNYFIVSLYKGKKQLYTTTTDYSRINMIDVTGISLEAKYKLTPNSYVVGEVAQSLSPDFRYNPAVKNKFDFKEKINKGFSVKGYSYFPATRSVLEGMYKFKGANFQSFTTLQNNSETTAWYIKAEQSLFKRHLKLTGSYRKNDFSNPYIIQKYSSNTLYKSLQAVFRAKKWPTISVGYIPVSQLTSIDSQLVENNFQSINATMNHSFLIGFRRATITVVYNKFYNNESDTSLLYYNALNIMSHMSVAFDFFDLEAGVNHSLNTNWKLAIIEGGIRIKPFGSFEGYVGAKYNDFSSTKSEIGITTSIRFFSKKIGAFNLMYDNSLIPTNYKSYIRNELFNFSYTKFF